MNADGETLLEIQLDETRSGHDQTSEILRECDQEVSEEDELLVALEATGGLKTLAPKTQRMVERSVEPKNELQALLPRAHPELVQYTRNNLP